MSLDGVRADKRKVLEPDWFQQRQPMYEPTDRLKLCRAVYQTEAGAVLCLWPVNQPHEHNPDGPILGA